MSSPFELEIAVIESHLIVLPTDLLAHRARRNDELRSHRKGRHLNLAGEVEIEHEAKGLGHRAADRQQPVVAKDEAAETSEVADDALRDLAGRAGAAA